MLRALLASLLLLVPVTLAAGDSVAKDEFRSRRAALRKDLDGTVVLFGKTEGNDEVFGFVQEPNFYYLSGWSEPGAVLLITPEKETLFLPHHRPRREYFTGRRASAEDQNVQALTGFDDVLPMEKFEASIAAAFDMSENVYALLGATPESTKLQERYPFRSFADAAPRVAKLRMKKSPSELAAIRRATDVSMAGHRAAWSRLAAGLYEYQIAATVTNVYMESGCDRLAYAPIIGSGPNGAVLHYSANKRRMDQGEMVVMDTAAQCDGYASDITRTVPVGGKFSARERELYDIVLGAQKAAIAAVKPGARLSGPENTINALVKTYFAEHGKDLHGKPLDKYYTHGIGHQVGLEVHDADTRAPLEEGMVITIEPGLYIPEENIGIRIEDVLLVTANGSRVLSAALPKEPEELEKALAK